MFGNKRKSVFIKTLKAFFPLLLIVLGGVAWAYFKATTPVIERKPPARQVRNVQTEIVSMTEARTAISAMGTVVPSREVTLKARISGEVMDIAPEFVPGGHISKGTGILTLDKSDYEIQFKKAESALESAKAELAIEQGSQNIAREELRLLSESSSEAIPETDLALRKPQLKQAMASVASAEADLRQARLDLERTSVKAPFNALIIDRNVNIGTYVGAGETLATIVGTDEYWVEALVSLDQLQMIDLDSSGGCTAVVHSQSGNGVWQGKVLRVEGRLNETSRMATVIVAVSNPLAQTENPLAQSENPLAQSENPPAQSAAPLMIDDYVNIEIAGRELPDVIEIPRASLRDGNTVWVNSDNSLDIRPVTLAWKSSDKVYIDGGLTNGEQVIVSDLSAPVQGMALKVLDATGGDADNI